MAVSASSTNDKGQVDRSFVAPRPAELVDRGASSRAIEIEAGGLDQSRLNQRNGRGVGGLDWRNGQGVGGLDWRNGQGVGDLDQGASKPALRLDREFTPITPNWGIATKLESYAAR
ncbi:hypothetical protein [Cryobacterium sp. Y11]|uniref:hypothetical protein n=1 Tax=Cryobacterium sp. Y11 TaxID=2045016 RepID=UPI000CE42DDF|nr:hypothetical protein [Cryobacterium sp. Y11]